MTRDHKKLDPRVIEKVLKALAAAKEDVLNGKTMEALLKAKPEDLVGPDVEAEVLKGNANPAGGWIHSPAMMRFFAAADKRLTRVANWAGMPVKRVAKVHARLLRGTKLLIITPGNPEDLTAIPVNRRASAAMFNLLPLLGEAGLAVEKGYRELYDVSYVPKESSLWPALVIDLDQVKERRLEPTAKNDEEGASTDTNTAAAAKRGRNNRRKTESQAAPAVKPPSSAPPDSQSGSSTP